MLTARGGSATVSLRRFADHFPEDPLGRISPGGSGGLTIRPDRAPQPWHVRVAPEAQADGVRRAVLILAGACLLAAPTVLALLLGRLLRAATADRRHRGVGAGAVRYGRRAGAAADDHARPSRPRRAGRAHRLERALDPVGATSRAGRAERPAARALRRRPPARGRHAAGPRPAARRRTGAGRRRRDRDRLRPVGPAPARPHRAGELSAAPPDGSSSRSRTGTPRARWPRSGSCCARGSPATDQRPRAMRLVAAGASPVLAAGLYLTYSRGALAVAVLGLLVLAALAPSRAQLRAAAVVLVAGACVAGCIELLPDGVTLLAVLIAAGAVTAFLVARTGAEPPRGPALVLAAASGGMGCHRSRGGRPGGGRHRRAAERARAVGGRRRRPPHLRVSSNRYEYWRVALGAFRDDPLIGTGSGGFRVVWLQERPIRETVRDTHSLEFEVAAELGLVGLLALALTCGGVIVTARRALADHGPTRRRRGGGARRVVPSCLDRLGLADAGRHAARARPRRPAHHPVGGRTGDGGEPTPLSGSRRRISAATRRSSAGSAPALTHPSAVQALRLSGSEATISSSTARAGAVLPVVHRTSASADVGRAVRGQQPCVLEIRLRPRDRLRVVEAPTGCDAALVEPRVALHHREPADHADGDDCNRDPGEHRGIVRCPR